MSTSHQLLSPSSNSIGTPTSEKVENRAQKRLKVTQGVRSFWADHYMASAARDLPANDIFSFYQSIVGQASTDKGDFMAISGRSGFRKVKNRASIKKYAVTWRSEACRKYHAEHSAWYLDAPNGPKCKQTLGSSGGSRTIGNKGDILRPFCCIYRSKGCLWQGNIHERICHTRKCDNKELPFPLVSREPVKEVDGYLFDFQRLVENVEGQLLSLDESYLTSFDKRNEEELLEQIQQEKLLEDMKLLKEKNVRLLKEVSVLLDEERKQREFHTHLSVLGQLRSTLENLQNEIAPLKENDPGLELDPVDTLESTNPLTKVLNDCGSFLRGICRVVSDMNCEQIGNKRKKYNESSDKYGSVDQCEIKEEVKEEVDFEFITNNKQITELSHCHGRAIAVTHHSGDPRYKRIVNRKVEFGPLSTISAPYAVVPPRAKSWYEVRYVCCGFGSYASVQRVGWCSSRLPRTRMYTDRAVGDDLESYSFDPFHGHKYNGTQSVWGEYFEREGVGYVGVALDMINGEISFSLNGVWEEPMGVAFNKLSRDAQLFPAISGCDVTIEVNFGEQEFVYGPPDGTYVPLNSI